MGNFKVEMLSFSARLPSVKISEKNIGLVEIYSNNTKNSPKNRPNESFLVDDYS